MRIAIVDCGTGNLGSIANMLKRLGQGSEITSDATAIEAADKVILPGIGAFDHGMRVLRERGLVEPLGRVRDRGTPVLGICLGMQLMTASSEEGELAGLGWVDAEVVRFPRDALGGLKVPHIGWNAVTPRKASRLFEGMHAEPRFYFVHSFHVRARRDTDVLATTVHGYEFCCAFESGNVVGVQFHPEKSHKFGMRLFEAFTQHY